MVKPPVPIFSPQVEAPPSRGLPAQEVSRFSRFEDTLDDDASLQQHFYTSSPSRRNPSRFRPPLSAFGNVDAATSHQPAPLQSIPKRLLGGQAIFQGPESRMPPPQLHIARPSAALPGGYSSAHRIQDRSGIVSRSHNHQTSSIDPVPIWTPRRRNIEDATALGNPLLPQHRQQSSSLMPPRLAVTTSAGISDLAHSTSTKSPFFGQRGPKSHIVEEAGPDLWQTGIATPLADPHHDICHGGYSSRHGDRRVQKNAPIWEPPREQVRMADMQVRPPIHRSIAPRDQHGLLAATPTRYPQVSPEHRQRALPTELLRPRSRLSLRPNHGHAAALPGSQDAALARVHGVRGLDSRQSHSGARRNGPLSGLR